MNLTNYHSHCSFCDGKAPMEDFVKSAIAAGFTSYGISSHAPLPFETCWTLSQERVPDYLQEIGRLKQRYAGEIEIYAGLEIDYLNEIQNPANSYFQALPLDYRIGSSIWCILTKRKLSIQIPILKISGIYWKSIFVGICRRWSPAILLQPCVWWKREVLILSDMPIRFLIMPGFVNRIYSGRAGLPIC